MEHLSKISNPLMNNLDKMSAARFIMTMPLDQPYGIQSLPVYVFTYIYEVGCATDLPWITFIDDDTGQRIIKSYVTEDPENIAKLCNGSQLLRDLDVSPIIMALYHEKIGVTRFELALLAFFKTYKIRTI